jgi:hypothetical protein
MALILEVRDRRGIATWHALDALPVTLGRAASNDIIVDDPFVDATHARIALDETGALQLEDLGSVNGIRRNGTRLARVPAVAGAEVRIGRTTLRFRDRTETVPPAIADAPDLALPRGVRWVTTTWGNLALAGILSALAALTTWLASSDRSTGSGIFVAVLMVLVLLMAWAGIWSVAARGADRRFHLFGHVAVAASVAIVFLAYNQLNDWLLFFFPDAAFPGVLYFGLLLVGIGVLVGGHLAVANVLSRRGRFIAAGSVSALALLVVVIMALVSDDRHDWPQYSHVLKPIAPSFVPTSSTKDFVAHLTDARKDVDEEATQPGGERTAPGTR